MGRGPWAGRPGRWQAGKARLAGRQSKAGWQAGRPAGRPTGVWRTEIWRHGHVGGERISDSSLPGRERRGNPAGHGLDVLALDVLAVYSESAALGLRAKRSLACTLFDGATVSLYAVATCRCSRWEQVVSATAWQVLTRRVGKGGRRHLPCAALCPRSRTYACTVTWRPAEQRRAAASPRHARQARTARDPASRRYPHTHARTTARTTARRTHPPGRRRHRHHHPAPSHWPVPTRPRQGWPRGPGEKSHAGDSGPSGRALAGSFAVREVRLSQPPQRRRPFSR